MLKAAGQFTLAQPRADTARALRVRRDGQALPRDAALGSAVRRRLGPRHGQRAPDGQLRPRRRALRDAGVLGRSRTRARRLSRRARTPPGCGRRTRVATTRSATRPPARCTAVSTAEQTSSNDAVTATAGKILTYQGKPAFTQFSSSSGGWTSKGSVPYLPAKKDPYDNIADERQPLVEGRGQRAFAGAIASRDRHASRPARHHARRTRRVGRSRAADRAARVEGQRDDDRRRLPLAVRA